MSLRFYFGASGVGKSTQCFQEMIRRSRFTNDGTPPQKVLIIVPDQFTLQTQKTLSRLHENGGILWIDVLSFGRLAHRVLEKHMGSRVPILDDTGKSLVIQRVASKDLGLQVLGANMRKIGYVHEIKSMLSEFMQYGISPNDMDELIELAGKRGALSWKLKDLQILYQAFCDFIQGHFITAEETLDQVSAHIKDSGVVDDALVVFDGFTGFTPLQERVLYEIMKHAKETIVTLTIGEEDDPYSLGSEQALFYLSKRTVSRLQSIANKAGVERGDDVFLHSERAPRYVNNPALHALESRLFRQSAAPFFEPQDFIRLFEASSPREEVRQCGRKIQEAIRERHLAYRDIAVILGDPKSYSAPIESEFAKLGIPFFLDQSRSIVLNPMIEAIKSALQVRLQDFSQEAVFRFLRCRMTDLTMRDVDALEDYIHQSGIRGASKWTRPFTKTTPRMGDVSEALERLNELRERVMENLAPLCETKKTDSVKAYLDALYEFLIKNRFQERLHAFELQFDQSGDPVRAKEYAQIYRLVMDLLDQMHTLLGDETISMQEFSDILEAGFGEIKVGTLPQSVDRVMVGDLERSRLTQVKLLFVLGVNDGYIPQTAKSGGIVSWLDREFLKESGITLSPTPREQMFIQKCYLYMNLTKPSLQLQISYARTNQEGKTLRPSYLIDELRRIFPGLTPQCPQADPKPAQIVGARQGLRYLANALREHAAGQSTSEVQTLYAAYGGEDTLKARTFLQDAAFRRYQDSSLPKAVAQALFSIQVGKTYLLENSVSRLETYAQCAYRHFLEYGLSLRERQEFHFDSLDMGNVFHEVLDRFSKELEKSDYTWFTFPEDYAREAIARILEFYAATYKETVLFDNARNTYAITRMGRILTRSVLTLQKQLKKGAFVPDAFELSFESLEVPSVKMRLSPDEAMNLRGRIDRVDIAGDDERVYVKVMDYKSGVHSFELAAVYVGLQLQLIVYMNAALEVWAKKNPDKDIVPAALLYYHIDDPTVESATPLTEEELERAILQKLRTSGVVSDDEEAIKRLDSTLSGKSDVIPVERKKDGAFSAASSVMSREELRIISTYVSEKVASLGRDILDGRITKDPIDTSTVFPAGSCQYCPYQSSCGFDPMIPGYRKREIVKSDKESLLESMAKVQVDEEAT